MAVARFRIRQATGTNKVAQVKTITITAASTGLVAVWTLTRTLDTAETATVSYTEDGSPTVAEIATGLYDAWLASTNPYINEITPANPSDGVLTLTAGTAGDPFSVALADDGDGTHTETATTANESPGDYSQTTNWTTDAEPTTDDDVVIPSGSADIRSGLVKSSVAIDRFVIEDGFSGKLGRHEYGQARYLQIKPNSVEINGKGQLVMVDVGAEAIDALIRSMASARQDGLQAVMLKGTALGTVEILHGQVGIASLEQEAATITTLLIGFVTTPQSDSNVTVGTGVTLTTLTQQAGMCLLKCAATTATVSKNATLTTEGTGALTTVNNYGLCYPQSSGTITTLNGYGVTDFTRDRSAKTVTTYNAKPGGTLIVHAGITIGTYNPPAAAGEHKIIYVD